MSPVHNSPEKALELERSIVTRFSNPALSTVLEFWTTDQCLVAPVSLKRHAQYEKACKDMRRSGWPVVIRSTGGGVTPQGPGILNVALAYALDPVEKPSINGVYEMFCAPLISLLGDFDTAARTASVPCCFCDGEYNIVVGDQKIMGTAQRWTRVQTPTTRQIVFVHALILLDADIESSVGAINQLHMACGIDQNIKSSAHINLRDVAKRQGEHFSQQRVVQKLSGLYHTELAALTE